jgi:hypothetical protein
MILGLSFWESAFWDWTIVFELRSRRQNKQNILKNRVIFVFIGICRKI